MPLGAIVTALAGRIPPHLAGHIRPYVAGRISPHLARGGPPCRHKSHTASSHSYKYLKARARLRRPAPLLCMNEWRASQDLPRAQTEYGPLTDRPDWSVLAPPAPPGAGGRQRPLPEPRPAPPTLSQHKRRVQQEVFARIVLDRGAALGEATRAYREEARRMEETDRAERERRAVLRRKGSEEYKGRFVA